MEANNRWGLFGDTLTFVNFAKSFGVVFPSTASPYPFVALIPNTQS